ncbi:GlxA family transcriptional regulator [Falsiroseomonas oryzae]|uniref:GlxA family transcriptional regulator n=1 Tax=Falsiroseomonas oryzae TaxID=2766473 RepID=UPI0022EB84F7|nr:GlxA family transcriptional regulator [Roseomonas sp. MO-31]
MAKHSAAAGTDTAGSGPPDPRGRAQRARIPLRRGQRRGPRRIAFLLIPGFAVLSYACAMEPYRAANELAEEQLYTWRHVSPHGRPVAASNGIAILPDQGIDRPCDVDDLLVCAGGNPTAFDDPATLAWLRAQATRGVRIGGVAGGPEILARAGLLSDHRCTAHWEYIPAMRERFPELQVTRSLYEIDRDRCTCSGGTAALDMAVALIEAEYGRPLAHAVAEWFLHTRPRAADEPQRMSLRERYEVGHPGLLQVLAEMEEALEDPLPRAVLARHAGVSVRQLERLFRAHLGRSIGAHYLGLRLEHARRLLRQTSLSVLETSLACGFTSAAHFSRAYRARFGLAPRTERQATTQRG